MESRIINNRNEIVFFIDSLTHGGAEGVVASLAEKMREKGYKVSIVLMRNDPVEFNISNDISVLYASMMPVRSLWGRVIRKIFVGYKKFRQYIYKPLMLRVGVYDKLPKTDETAAFFYAVYATPYREFLRAHPGVTAFGFLIRSNICLLQAGRNIKNIKIVFCERNNPYRPDVSKHIIRLRDKYYRRADIGVFQTEEQKQYYQELRDGNYVIPNPVNPNLPDMFSGVRKKEIVNFCRITEQKNLKLLIDAFELLHCDYPEYRLCIYGNGNQEKEIDQYIKEKKLYDCVTRKGFSFEIHRLINGATMYVSTSNYEGISNSMLEAMALGLPCVCTDCDGGGARMMIRDHENGLLVPKGDTDAVYCAMKEIIENPDLAKKLSEEAYKIRYELSTDKIVEKWMEVIR